MIEKARMKDAELISSAKEFEYKILQNDASGHDFEHPLRVNRIATTIAKKYNCDLVLIQLAALLHDVDDFKLFPNQDRNHNLKIFFSTNAVPLEYQTNILSIIEFLSRSEKKDHIPIEAQIVQDADNLDALGAIGIARLFAFGGANGILPIVSSDDTINTSIGHYYNTLTKFPQLMNTPYGRREANRRVKFMRKFVIKLSKEVALD